ncbi:MAG: C4-dicarboxylate ABC transporter [Flavobacteriales bacterium]|nr:C4-dicarboxylate ABC transporter [Flavobacteriales bacterium]
MHSGIERIKPLDLKSSLQLISGLIFIGLGLYILLGTFEDNTVLIGIRKQLFGGILVLYGIVRMFRVYNAIKKTNHED